MLGVLLAIPLHKTNISHVSHVLAIFVSKFPIILVLCLYMAYNSGIILAKIVTYYS